MNQIQREIIDAIMQERIAQDKKWGGASHDDQHNAWDWIQYIRNQESKAFIAEDFDEYDSRMVKVAALAIAALESTRRKRSNGAKP